MVKGRAPTPMACMEYHLDGKLGLFAATVPRCCGTKGKIKQCPPNAYVSRAVQRHPDGGQFEFARSPTRTPQGAYV